jgi:hypothetical protein
MRQVCAFSIDARLKCAARGNIFRNAAVRQTGMVTGDAIGQHLTGQTATLV